MSVSSAGAVRFHFLPAEQPVNLNCFNREKQATSIDPVVAFSWKSRALPTKSSERKRKATTWPLNQVIN